MLASSIIFIQLQLSTQHCVTEEESLTGIKTKIVPKQDKPTGEQEHLRTLKQIGTQNGREEPNFKSVKTTFQISHMFLCNAHPHSAATGIVSYKSTLHNMGQKYGHSEVVPLLASRSHEAAPELHHSSNQIHSKEHIHTKVLLVSHIYTMKRNVKSLAIQGPN